MSSLLRVITILLAAAAGACTSLRKTIEIDNGDLIDCVEIYQQPAVNKNNASSSSLLGSQQIHQAKSSERSMKAAIAGNNDDAASRLKKKARQQSWRKHGSCPEGSVPILRPASSRRNPEVAELVRRASPFRRPRPAGNNGSSSVVFFLPEAGMDTPTGKVEVAAAYSTDGPFLGAKADIPYWKIGAVHPAEFSMSYLLIGNTLDPNYRPMPGAKPPPDLTNQIAVGLIAWPSHFGDSLLRLFVYYTTDGGVASNCFNLECNGFQLQHSEIALGDSWDKSDSEVGGDRFGVTVSIHRDPAGDNWRVSVMNEDIGYYPETIFNTRFPQAAYVEMGGRVLDTRPGGAHTATPMGNGIPACAGSRFAATIMEYSGINFNGALFNDAAHRTIATSPSCYGANPMGFGRSRQGYNVAFGGPGGKYCDQPDD